MAEARYLPTGGRYASDHPPTQLRLALPARWLFLYLGLALLACAGFYAATMSTAEAAHPWSNDEVWTVHSLNTRENTCVQNVSTSLTFAQVHNRVRFTLKEDNTDVDWHLPVSDRFPNGNDKISIFMRSDGCTYIRNNDPNLFDDTSMRFWVYRDDDPKLVQECDPYGTICVHLQQPGYTYTWGHGDYHHADVYLNTNWIDETGSNIHGSTPWRCAAISSATRPDTSSDSLIRRGTAHTTTA